MPSRAALRRLSIRRRKPPRAPKRGVASRLLRLILGCILLYVGLCIAGLTALRWIDPPFTAVHAQRRIESLFQQGEYGKQFTFVPLESISPDLRHAVIAAEDGRFYQHHGVDWLELRKVLADEVRRGRLRGASTITQQLVKNLFMTTHRSALRKPFELLLVPVAELILRKRRILELYLNVIEWGPGVYGAEAASRRYYGVTAAQLGREQAARLAACIPYPSRRRPEMMDNYSAEILARMSRMGW